MREKRIHQVFVASLLLKGFNALLEIVTGVSLFLVSTSTIVATLNRYSLDHLAQDPNDWVANRLMDFTRHFSVAEHDFYAFYLLSHGLIKSVVLIGLLREKRWSYPASFAVFGAFIAYQLYRYTYTHDFGLIVLSIFDLFVIALAVHEWRLVKRHLPTH